MSVSNSLVGSRNNDVVGGYDVVALTNGNYVVCSPFWDSSTATDVGAATWGSGTTGVSGPISFVNSMIGSTTNDQVSGTEVEVKYGPPVSEVETPAGATVSGVTVKAEAAVRFAPFVAVTDCEPEALDVDVHE